ncbi:hypothetical protein [Nocardia vaccinii]|uniref:hypothetical protein n=1 Tax=Nocardia vaccinii TaxID=1822 RepID=UPI0008339295|nr:hypothetical protein [Nocardia vaccinii]
MNQPTDLGPDQRQLLVRRALDDRDHDVHVLLRVRCGRGHHVATVFGTVAGAVYESWVGMHAHGRRDFVDEAHHAPRKRTRYVDLLDAGRVTDDVVPAGCECGGHGLSRAEMRGAIDAHTHTLQLR